MENLNNQLNNIKSQIDLIYDEFKNKISDDNKIELYQKSKILHEQANKILIKIENLIKNMDIEKFEKNIPISKVIEYLNLISTPHLSFDELLFIVKELQTFIMMQPMEAEIIDNIEEHIIEENY